MTIQQNAAEILKEAEARCCNKDQQVGWLAVQVAVRDEEIEQLKNHLNPPANCSMVDGHIENGK